MFNSSVSQACDEMNSQAQGQEAGSTMSKSALKETTINICKNTRTLKQSNLTRDKANTVPKLQ